MLNDDKFEVVEVMSSSWGVRIFREEESSENKKGILVIKKVIYLKLTTYQCQAMRWCGFRYGIGNRYLHRGSSAYEEEEVEGKIVTSRQEKEAAK